MSQRQWLASFLCSTLMLSGAAYASSISNVSALSQSMFQSLTEDVGSAISYRDMMPAAPLGITGFDVGLTATDARLAHSNTWYAATGSHSNNIVVPSLQVQKGLPAGFDVGLTYSRVPGSNIKVVGGDLSYAIFGGGLLQPALTIRGTYTKMSGVSEMGLNTRSVELCLSKGFVFVTPYLGLGRVRTVGTPYVGGLTTVTLNDTKEYIGADFNLGIANLDLEIDRMGGATSYGANIGLRL